MVDDGVLAWQMNHVPTPRETRRRVWLTVPLTAAHWRTDLEIGDCPDEPQSADEIVFGADDTRTEFEILLRDRGDVRGGKVR